MYDVIGLAARWKPEDEARRLKARWALSLGVYNSGGADDYYLEKSLPPPSASFFVRRTRIWLAGFRGSRSL